MDKDGIQQVVTQPSPKITPPFEESITGDWEQTNLGDAF